MSQESVSQRLNDIVTTFEKGKKAAFARQIGMSPQGVQEILAGRKGDPSFKALVRILEAYPQVSIKWLVLGTGTMLDDNADVINSTESNTIEDIADKVIYRQLKKNQVDNYLSSMRDKQIINLLEEELLLKDMMDIVAREGRKISDKQDKTADEEIRLKEMRSEYRNLETQYSRGLRTRLNLLNLQHKYKEEAESVMYNIDGEANTNKPFGGLITKRLEISKDVAQKLIESGRLSAVNTDKDFYVTEQAVREFLGQA